MSLPPTLSSPSQTKPLTDPAELFTLLGRMVICLVLATLTVALLMRRAVPFALFVGAISIFVQRITIKQWRRMRDERMEAETEALRAEAALAASQPVPGEGEPAP